MTDPHLEHLQRHPAFQELARRKQRLTWSMTLLMLAIYFGFVVTMAFFPEVLGRSLAGGATTLGIPLAVGVILLSFILTAIYVRQTNRVLDPLTERLLREVRP